MKSRSKGTSRHLTLADADQALILYNELTVGPPASNRDLFDRVMSHQGTTVFGAFDGPDLASMVTLHLLPNLLWDGRPYALIENVVTRQSKHRQGFGRSVMEFAIEAAWAANAYKIMLMTGQRRNAVGFYEALGFSGAEKKAMVLRRA